MFNETKTIYGNQNSPQTAQLSPKEAMEILAPLFLYTYLIFYTNDWNMPIPSKRWATSYPGR
jgi:hypothetical protein